MTEPPTASTPTPVNPASLSPSRSLSHALFAALVVAHTQPLFATSAALIPGFAERYAVALPLVAAEWLHDFVWLGVLGSALAVTAQRAGARAETLRALLLAMLAGLLAGLGIAARFELDAVATWALLLGTGAATFGALHLAVRVSTIGFVLGVTLIALGCGYSNAIPTDASATAFNHLGALALTWGAVWATRSLRAPMLLFSIVAGLALAAIAESNWLTGLSTLSALPSGAHPTSEAANVGAPRPNLIVIVLDSFRADALDRAPDGNTPNLASFARESRVAVSARSTSSSTLPAHASLFTGSYPTTHGAHFLPRGSSDREAGILVDANVTLAELLRARGYATWGVVANHDFLHAATNIHQGFDVWDTRYAVEREVHAALSELVTQLTGLGGLGRLARWVGQLDEAERNYRHKTYRLASEMDRSALALLDREREEGRADNPFFLFLNYMDAHAPYIPPAATRSEIGDVLHESWLDLHDGPGGPAVMRGDRDLREDERAHLEAAYAGEVHDLDAALGSLFENLKARDLYDDTWIVITSDHGELLGEHRLLGHASELYEEAIRVPLLVRSPGGADLRPIVGQVQLVDILPSLAPRFGLTLAEAVEGVPFDQLGDRAAVAEHFEDARFVDAFGARFKGDSRAWIEADRALYASTEHPPEWRGAVDAESRQRVERELAEWIRRRHPVASGVEQPELSPEER